MVRPEYIAKIFNQTIMPIRPLITPLQVQKHIDKIINQTYTHVGNILDQAKFMMTLPPKPSLRNQPPQPTASNQPQEDTQSADWNDLSPPMMIHDNDCSLPPISRLLN
jgi:hypothetical protein